MGAGAGSEIGSSNPPPRDVPATSNIKTMMMSAMFVITLLAFAPVTAFAVQDTTIVRGPLGQRLDSTLRAAESRGFHGTVLIERNGEIVLLAGYGLADEAAGTRFGPATVVQIGSNVKDFTKVAVLQLVEAGRLSLDDSLPRFFADVPADKRGITIRQLMDHTAGFPMVIGPDSEVIDRGDFLERLFATPLKFGPGEGNQYSNPGYSVLAAIVEQLSGQSYDRYVADHVFRPVGMRQTGYLLPGFDRRRVAHGYNAGRKVGTMLDMPHGPDGLWWNLRGNGGMLSTVSEMLAFYRALLDGKLLSSAAHRALVINPDIQGPSVLAGSDLTSFFMFARFPGVGVTLIMASNHAGWQAPRMLRELEPVLGVRGPPRVVREGGPGAARDTAPAALPRSGAGRTVAAWFEAFNSGDPEVMRRFLEQHADSGPNTPSMPVRLQRYRQMRDDLKRLTPVAVQEATMGIIVEARTEDGRTVSITFDVDTAAPYHMRSIRIEAS